MRAEDPKNELLRPPPVPRDPWDLDYDEEASLEEVEAIISAPAAPTVNVEPSSESIEVDVPSPSSPLDTIAEADEDEGLTEGDMSVEVEDYSKRPTLPLVCALFPHGVLISGRETLVYDTPSGCARLPTLGPDYKPIEGSGRLDTPPRHLWEKIARAAEAAFHRDHAKFGMWNWRDYAKELEAEDALPNHGSLQALHDTFNSKGWDRLSGEYFQEGADLGYSDSLDDLLRAEDGVDL
ncbi:hypothetical protein GLOTRDRAFT_138642 [Gloeophyllum trabeum ATCC 11539]|uniref:Uncharacterized protein n=1 Tax=Gloeophyllum trabeum (strain ATCC 11539 / FP-39264 / Madison 617) TaxID=670483 RepID=S7RS90_GLOTA|nr:uncharacterized protein GLOTRDRAFT_138642 [Gloeophyllum trabeum ATCC 11539]EPQ55899.1 hypothetical protein GLOTRDRAFT_138642 [Gloeophyllum trabeum ATCC 11539]